MTDRFEVCRTEELPPGERMIVEPKGISIGVFNVDGDYFALKNECPHRRAPLCRGKLTGTTTTDTVGEYQWDRPGRIIRCPWHGWEFDVTTGESVFNPHEVKAKTFETEVKADETDEPSDQANTMCLHEPPVETYDIDVVNGTVFVKV